MELTTLFERAVEIGSTRPVFDHRARMAQAADELNLAGHLQAHLGVAEAALVALINVVYATDSDGQPANYEKATGRILIRGLPWGDSGWRKWGLRKWEAEALRKLLVERSQTRRRLPALFDYNQYNRQWHINAAIYPDTEAALIWLKKDGPSLAEWRTIVTEYRSAAAERMRRKRNPNAP